MSQKPVLKVKIRDTQNIVFEGEAERISSFNEVGRFDVFPMHANFISIITKEITVYHNQKLVKEIKVEQAVMKVKQDSAHIFLGIEALALDEENAETPASAKK